MPKHSKKKTKPNPHAEKTTSQQTPTETKRRQKKLQNALNNLKNMGIEQELIDIIASVFDLLEENMPNKYTGLHISVIWENIIALSTFLNIPSYKMENLNAKSIEGHTPLYLATLSKEQTPEALEIIKLLLSHGANPDITTPMNKIPLHSAAEQGYLEAVKLLLEKTKNPNICAADPKIGKAHAIDFALYNRKLDVAEYLLNHPRINSLLFGSQYVEKFERIDFTKSNDEALHFFIKRISSLRNYLDETVKKPEFKRIINRFDNVLKNCFTEDEQRTEKRNTLQACQAAWRNLVGSNNASTIDAQDFYRTDKAWKEFLETSKNTAGSPSKSL